MRRGQPGFLTLFRSEAREKLWVRGARAEGRNGWSTVIKRNEVDAALSHAAVEKV
jgi:hypothetical protein